MWWDEFELRLTNAFAIVDKDAGCKVHTDEMKLRLADFLTTIKTNIKMQMAMVPMMMTYSRALISYRNTVNQRFPQGSVAKRNKRAKIRSTSGRRDSCVTNLIEEVAEVVTAVVAGDSLGDMMIGM